MLISLIPYHPPSLFHRHAQRSAKTEKLIAQRAVTDPSALKMAKAWEAAIAPAKSLPMNAIMLYMSGSGVQIFSMMVVGMLITGPLKGIAGMDAGELSSSAFAGPEQNCVQNEPNRQQTSRPRWLAVPRTACVTTAQRARRSRVHPHIPTRTAEVIIDKGEEEVAPSRSRAYIEITSGLVVGPRG